MILRPFDPYTDYPALATIRSLAEPNYPTTEKVQRARDANRADYCRHARFVAIENNRIIGIGEYDQRTNFYVPDRYTLTVWITPEKQGQGIGKALYNHAQDALLALQPTSIRSFAQENHPRALRFLKDRGYQEVMRDGSATLSLASVDLTPLPPLRNSLHQQEGVQIVPLGDLVEIPDRFQRFYELHNILMRDVPPIGERTIIPFDVFLKQRLQTQEVLHEGIFLALAPNGDFIGVSQVTLPSTPHPDALDIGITGVLREWRKKKIALALKLTGIEFARSRGALTLRTFNASDNIPILTMNQQLGFQREPWRVHFSRTL